MEKSLDGKEWKRFHEVEGNGFSSSIHEYTEYDMYPSPGINYYRLKQVDYDGKYEYSGHVNVIR